MDDQWRTIQCPRCGGHGIVSVFSAFDFEGPGECGLCGGNGHLFIRPTGHCFLYPGGPACGMWDKRAYEEAQPVRREPDG